MLHMANNSDLLIPQLHNTKEVNNSTSEGTTEMWNRHLYVPIVTRLYAPWGVKMNSSKTGELSGGKVLIRQSSGCRLQTYIFTYLPSQLSRQLIYILEIMYGDVLPLHD